MDIVVLHRDMHHRQEDDFFFPAVCYRQQEEASQLRGVQEST